MEAAKACLGFIEPGLVVGLGAGTTISYLVDWISEQTDLAKQLTFVSSSFKTRLFLKEKGLIQKLSSQINRLDVYFDGCDCFDNELNALKSGGGIHTHEKILASMANNFILVGDESKLIPDLGTSYPLVIEILPEALLFVENFIKSNYPEAFFDLRMSQQKDGAVISENGNFLADIRFRKFPDLGTLNINIKMIPGVVEHSLFYRMASKAIIAGEKGVQVICADR
ncbi:ribose 5-phosphate isomerase A [Mucilaginibacter sp.]|uniref:ribose 5-phosphate isomerase A n=1 Tax=Mucilaginibacter sp. TaxID=1882438 RepID=UPI00262AB62C|nr:ribose 5-phosphate isomerase A [Mucilaginibacter sp.]